MNALRINMRLQARQWQALGAMRTPRAKAFFTHAPLLLPLAFTWQTMRAAAHCACNPDASSVTYRQNQQQLAAWCAALLGRLYVSAARCQQALVDALLAPAARMAEVLTVLHLCSPELRGTTAAAAATLTRRQYGPMYTSLHTRGTAVGASSVGTPLAPASVNVSLATLRSRQGSEAGASSGPGTPGPSAAGRQEMVAREEAALAAALEDSGAVVRLTPVQEGGKPSDHNSGALVVLVGTEGDLLASTAATRTPAASPQGEV